MLLSEYVHSFCIALLCLEHRILICPGLADISIRFYKVRCNSHFCSQSIRMIHILTNTWHFNCSCHNPTFRYSYFSQNINKCGYTLQSDNEILSCNNRPLKSVLFISISPSEIFYRPSGLKFRERKAYSLLNQCYFWKFIYRV